MTAVSIVMAIYGGGCFLAGQLASFVEATGRSLGPRQDRPRIFPGRTSVIRLVGIIYAEQDDEWPDGRRYFRPETMALIDADPVPEEVARPCCSGAETSRARTTCYCATRWDLTLGPTSF